MRRSIEVVLGTSKESDMLTFVICGKLGMSEVIHGNPLWNVGLRTTVAINGCAMAWADQAVQVIDRHASTATVPDHLSGKELGAKGPVIPARWPAGCFTFSARGAM